MQPKSSARESVNIASTSWGGIDPLSAAMFEDFSKSPIVVDPLSTARKASVSRDDDAMPNDFVAWDSHKLDILQNYTTSEKMSLRTSFLVPGISARVPQGASVTEKVKHRLEQLDEFEEGSVKEMQNLSQNEFVKHIDDLNATLKEAWDDDQRVKALKLVIQCAKMLDETSAVQFYPSKFVLITDILDNFGNLVFQRINSKSKGADVDIAIETSKNWFYKIASIRELIPRFYVECAILQIYKFMPTDDVLFKNVLERLAKMIRGIGNNLIASYARSYLCRVSMRLNQREKRAVQLCYRDFFLTYEQVINHFVKYVD